MFFVSGGREKNGTLLSAINNEYALLKTNVRYDLMIVYSVFVVLISGRTIKHNI